MKTRSPLRASLRALILTVVIASACDSSNDPEPIAQLRFVHAAQGTAAVDFRVDGTPARTNVAYASNSITYINATTGNRALSARLTGGATDLASSTQDLGASRSYTAALVKRAAGPAIVLFADTNTAAAAGKTKLRVINVAPAAASVDVYVTAADADLATATPVATAVLFEKASKYTEVTAGTQRIRLTTAGTKTVVLDLTGFALPDGGVRTVVLMDANAGGAPLQSIVGADRN
jgi:hypothetical protein